MDNINSDSNSLAEKPRAIALLHIYPQYSYHTEANIVGNREGLLKLRAAIDEALAGTGEQTIARTPCGDTEETEPVFVTDGEGYEVFVIRNDSAWQESTWDRMAVPYTDECARFYPDDVIWPNRLFTEADLDRFYPNRQKI